VLSGVTRLASPPEGNGWGLKTAVYADRVRGIIRDVSNEPAGIGATKALNIRWTGIDEAPIYLANTFLAQLDAAVGGQPDQVILAVGQIVPPPVFGGDAEVRVALDALEYVDVKTLARYSITPARLNELIGLLTRLAKVFGPADNEGEKG